MARVTVEDCIVHVPNRFELVLLAAQRAKQISSGNPLTIDRDNDKDSVVALREIAEETITVESLRADAVNSFCKHQQADIADSKAVEEDEMHMQVEQAYQEATRSVEADVEDEIEGEDSGMSFDEENIDPED